MFHQDDLVRNKNYDYNRINVFPTVRFNYKFDQFRRFNFSYNGSTRQPSITQLQPVQDNSNPLEVYVGNPDLKLVIPKISILAILVTKCFQPEVFMLAPVFQTVSTISH